MRILCTNLPNFILSLALCFLAPSYMCVPRSSLTRSNCLIVTTFYSFVKTAFSINLGEWFLEFIFPETCSSSWIRFDSQGFNHDLRTRIYGQPLVGLSKAVESHWSNKKPAKALLLSFHGPVGTGKNYVAGILIKHMLEKNVNSKFYHLFSAKVHFTHNSQIETYKDQIQAWIRGNVSLCPKSVFVFDEVDKMPALLLDTLKPFVDYHQHIDRVDYRRAVFILLSNSGSDFIMRYMLEQKRRGLNRSEVYGDLDNQLPKYLYSEENGTLRNSELLQHHLVSRFIPFLPLERPHVISCIKDYLRDQDHDSFLKKPGFVDRVLKEMIFLPEEEKFFSSMGCKRVPDKIYLRISAEADEDNDSKGKTEF